MDPHVAGPSANPTITDAHLLQAMTHALGEVAAQTRVVFSPDSFRLASVEHPRAEYLHPPLLIPCGFGTHERYHHPSDPLRLTTWAIWIADLRNGSVELRVRVAVVLTAEQFAINEWTASNGFALEWACEQRTVVKDWSASGDLS